MENLRISEMLQKTRRVHLKIRILKKIIKKQKLSALSWKVSSTSKNKEYDNFSQRRNNFEAAVQ